MRLLDTQSLRLKEFVDNPPPYAILSHTWEDEEVVFSDLPDLDLAKTKKGFSKISNACLQAAKDKFPYVWIDTLCIDKSSSAELSEAINSMFAWYRESGKCYAYLSDVNDGGTNFKSSKWFTRAWTLQELLAPRHVKVARMDGEPAEAGMEFFSENWAWLGTKRSLAKSISTATGIATEYLTGRSLDMASVSMRMSWASERRATRAEDIAYSLLGIFDVNMPLLYGEGKTKAFRRLQEEIMKISEDETLFAWESAESALDAGSGNALASDPKDFIEAQDLVPFASDDLVGPYALTHRGLRMWLQLGIYDERVRPLRSMVRIKSQLKLHAAVLRCHVAHDFDHVVVIPLHHLTANLYIRDTTMTNVGLFPTKHLLDLNTIQEVYIKTTRIPAITNSVRRRYGFLIRVPPGFTIANASPREAWDAEDRIFRVEKNAERLHCWRASLELRSWTQHSGSPIYLSLGCDQEKHDSEVRAWCHLDDVVQTECGNGLTIFHPLQTRTRQSNNFLSHIWDAKKYGPDLKATITAEDVHGQRMFPVVVEHADKKSGLEVQNPKANPNDLNRHVHYEASQNTID